MTVSQPELSVERLLAPEFIQDFGLVVGAIVLAYVLSAALTVGATRLTTRTTSDLDDAIIGELRPAVFLGLLALAGWVSLDNLHLSERASYVVTGLLGTGAGVVLGRALYRAALLLIDGLARPGRARWRIDRRLVPPARYAALLVVWLGVLLAILTAWELHGALLGASAGVVGLALGLAAEGSLANVIAGLFIAADGSVRVGDFVVVGSDRGRVTHVGLRSIRFLTNDGVEISVPNAVLGSSRIVNETAGDDESLRVMTDVVLPHDADVERVRRLVEGEMPQLRGLAGHRRPEVRVLGHDERGVRVGVYFWLSEPALRLPGTDAVNTWLYKQLMAVGVAFALPRHELHADPASLPLGERTGGR